MCILRGYYVPEPSYRRRSITPDSYPVFSFDMRAEVNLADNPEDYNEGFGPIFLCDPRVAPRGDTGHRNSSCEFRGKGMRGIGSDTLPLRSPA